MIDATPKARWYFDVISPFAYLAFHRLSALRDRVTIEPVPVLFAGLLKHWGSKGPAELPTKRLHTYQYCVWAAAQQGLAFRMPPRHPFNPLSAQRLLIALGAGDRVVEEAFQFVFGEGRDPEKDFAGFAQRLQVQDPTSLISDPNVKQALLQNTQRAAEAGVFGVPTLAIRDRLFWGSDTLEWASQYLDEPDLFQRPDYEAAARTEFGIARA